MGGLQYEGGPVLHSNRTHLVFWQPAGSGLQYPAGYEVVMERFLTRVAAASHRAGNVYALSGQYTDGAGPAAYASTYGGAVVATDRLPARHCHDPVTAPPGWTDCVTDAQLQQELEHVVTSHGLPRSSSDIYFLVLPARLGTCTDTTSAECALGGSVSGYCGYHSEAADGLRYALIPFNAVSGHCQSASPRPNHSAADPALSTVSHEHLETITDPEVLASWVDADGNEMGDLCMTKFGRALGGTGATRFNETIGEGHYWLQEEWSNQDRSCQPRAQAAQVWLSTANRTTAGNPLSLTGHAQPRHGHIVAYAWTFGDGTNSPARVTTHSFTRPGLYRVWLRVTDSASIWSFATTTIQVMPRPALDRVRRQVVRRG
jgi:hypothetical protein